MSAVVHTGSRDARSACGTKGIVLALSLRPRRGIAITAAPASPDLRMSRRCIVIAPDCGTRCFLTELAPRFDPVIGRACRQLLGSVREAVNRRTQLISAVSRRFGLVAYANRLRSAR